MAMNEEDRQRFAKIALQIYSVGDADDLWEDGDEELRAVYDRHRLQIGAFVAILNDELVNIVASMIPDHL